MCLRNGRNGTLLYKSRWLKMVYDYATDGLDTKHIRFRYIPLLTYELKSEVNSNLWICFWTRPDTTVLGPELHTPRYSGIGKEKGPMLILWD